MHLVALSFLTLFFYSGLRVLFLFWNFALYQNLSLGDRFAAFLHGIRFDLSAVAMIAAPAFLMHGLGVLVGRDLKRASVLVFVLLQALFLALNLVDTEYVQFTGRRFTVELLQISMEIQGKFWATVLSSMMLFVLSVLVLSLYVIACLWVSREYLKRTKPVAKKIQFVTGFVMLVLLVIAARGGLQRKPIGFAHAQVFANPSLNHLTMNSSFSFLQTLRRKPLAREHYMPGEEMKALMNGATPGESFFSHPPFEKPQNVVVIIVESLSLDLMGKIHGDQGYTPFLDELAGKGLFFPSAFANARRSIEGIGAILGGIPALMSEPFISSPYATNTFWGLGTLLAPSGYGSTFFHGGHNGTMYFDQFMRSAGIGRYYGASEYGNSKDDDGTWGIWDAPFLLNMTKELDQAAQPFAATVFTLSSHNPYKVPQGFEGKFPKGTNEIHEVVGYTDWALRQFFKEAASKPWFNNTLFIVTADHTFKPIRESYQNDLGNYRIPVIFFHPQIKKWPTVDITEPVQHIDILPSILDFLGLTPPQVNLLGRSVFRKGPRYVVLSSEGYYWLVTKNHVLTATPKGEIQLEKIPPYLKNELQMSQNLQVDDPILKAELEKKLKATRQYFSEGLWDNSLYF